MTAKSLRVSAISRKAADRLVRSLHYSGSVVRNSQLHLGVWLDGTLLGAMQFGPPLDRRKMLGLVRGSSWSSVLELNRLAFDDRLPRNSESRAIAVAVRLIRKHAPQVKWLLSFADATRCGDGTIYRAAGFVLTGIKPSANTAHFPGVGVIHKMTLESSPTSARAFLGGRSYYDVTGGSYNWKRFCSIQGATILPGYQLRYVRFIDPDWRRRLSVAEIPFSEIPRDARMYLGEKRIGVSP